jgi:hypothetical protein
MARLTENGVGGQAFPFPFSLPYLNCQLIDFRRERERRRPRSNPTLLLVLALFSVTLMRPERTLAGDKR